MNPAETQECRPSLRNFSTIELEKLLSTILKEMRRRDSDHIKGDVMAISKALVKIRNPSAGEGPRGD
jgi:hypothetical protein